MAKQARKEIDEMDWTVVASLSGVGTMYEVLIKVSGRLNKKQTMLRVFEGGQPENNQGTILHCIQHGDKVEDSLNAQKELIDKAFALVRDEVIKESA